MATARSAPSKRLPSNQDPVVLRDTWAIFRAARARRLEREARETQLKQEAS